MVQNEANYAEKNVKILILDYFFEFECLNMRDNADHDCMNGSGLLSNHYLPVSMG